jgi:hypothetical protein
MKTLENGTRVSTTFKIDGKDKTYEGKIVGLHYEVSGECQQLYQVQVRFDRHVPIRKPSGRILKWSEFANVPIQKLEIVH